MNHSKELEKLLESQSFCILSTITKEGYPQARAMLKPCCIEGNKLYLHTNTASNKILQLQNNHKANLYFYDASLFEGMSLLGDAKILDETKKLAFWKDEYEFYYQKGLSDFSVIEFNCLTGEFYRNLHTDEFTF